MVSLNTNFVPFCREHISFVTQGRFLVLLTGFTESDNHGLPNNIYTQATRPSVESSLLRLKRSYSNLTVLRGSKSGGPNVDSLIDETCTQLDIPQLVFSCKHWLSTVQERGAVYYFDSPHVNGGEAAHQTREQFQAELTGLADLVIAFGGGKLAFNMVTSMLAQKKPVVLVSPHAAVGQTNAAPQTIERIIERIEITASASQPTFRSEIQSLARTVANRYLTLTQSRRIHGPQAASPLDAASYTSRVGTPEMRPGVYRNTKGQFVVRYYMAADSHLPEGVTELKRYSQRTRTAHRNLRLVERVFQRTQLVPIEDMPFILPQFADKIALSAIGYSSFDTLREQAFGIQMPLYEEFVAAVMSYLPVEIKAKADPLSPSFCYIFGGSGMGVDLGIMKAALSNGIPILGVVWENYLKYAVDEDVTIIYTHTKEEYASTYGKLMVGGATVPLGGADHSLVLDMVNWLSEPGDSLMLINSLLEIFSNRRSSGITVEPSGSTRVFNATEAFTELVIPVPGVPANELADATFQTIERLLWRINRQKELTSFIQQATAQI